MKIICGLDEAGRGALSGPLVVAAVVIPKEFHYPCLKNGSAIRDSKLLSPNQRAHAYNIIVERSIRIATVVLSANTINRKGINWANIEGFRRLIRMITADEFVVDGRWDLGNLGANGTRTQCVVRADQTIPAAIAAGIVAKVKRDELLRALHRKDPRFAWDRNTGHGTLEHIAAIRRYGVTPEHRTQFVATALSNANDRAPQYF